MANKEKQQRFLFIRSSWTLIFIVLIVLMFVSHLIAFFTLSRYSQHTQLQINRGIIARQIITLIEAVEINPPDKRHYIVNAIDIPNVNITLNTYPKYHIRISKLKIWDILLKIKQIPPTARMIQISVKFDDHLWLNISAIIVQSSWTIQFILFGFEFLIVIALLFIIWSLNRYNKPLKHFIQSIEKTGRNLHTAPLAENDGPLMVREAAKAVNSMQKRIQELIHDRTQMLAAISHDLRTPITRLKLRAQLLEDQGQQTKITDDLNEMEKMINESLTFFRDEQLSLEKSQIDIASLLYSLCTDYKETGNKIHYHGEKQDCHIKGNALALKRALSNVINNALKYGYEAKVSLNHKGKTSVITIEDKGQGIDEKDLEHVFKPFYRGEQSRSRVTGGIGLGLAVTHSIVQAHDGEIILKNIKPNGLRVKIILPES